MKQRKSGIELLRIISILLLVWVHDNTHKFGKHFEQWEYVLKDFIPLLTVNLFVMVSALYADKLTGKLIPLLKKVGLYYLIAFVISQIVAFSTNDHRPLSIITIINSAWYARAYLLAIIALSYLKFKLSVKQSLIFIVVVTVMPMIIWWFNLISSTNLIYPQIIPSYSFILIVTLIKVWGPILDIVKNWKISRLTICLFITILVKLVLDWISIKYYNKVYDHREYSQLFNILIPILIVSIFYNLNFSNKYINRLSTVTFLAYFMESPSRLRNVLWDNFFTGHTTYDYIGGIVFRFIVIMTLAFIIDYIVRVVNKKMAK